MYLVTFSQKLGLKPRKYKSLRNANRGVSRFCTHYLKREGAVRYTHNFVKGRWFNSSGEELAWVEIL